MYNVKAKIAEYLDENFSFPFFSTEEEGLSENLRECPPKLKKSKGFGDYSIHLRKFGNYKQIIEEVENHQVKSDLIVELKVINDLLNVYIDINSVTKKVLNYILNDEHNHPFSFEENRTKMVLVEFSSPNIAKPFHAGHLRSTILGNFISNLYQYFGYNVLRVNYLGDWGKQFGLLGVGLLEQGYTLDFLRTVPDNEIIPFLTEIYININKKVKAEQESDPTGSTTEEQAREYFNKLESGDEEKLELWSFIREKSVENLKKIYANLNITFDIFCGESDYASAEIPQVILDHPFCGHAEPPSQTVYFDLETFNLGKFVLQKKDGSSIYALRDVCAALDRFEKYHPHKMIYVVANEQDFYFERLFKTLSFINPLLSNVCEHISFGMVEGMKTREGNVTLLETVIQESEDCMLEKMQESDKSDQIQNLKESSHILAKAAVVVQDMKAERRKNYKFTMDRATNFNGQTGPYLEYSHVRLANIVEKAAEKNLQPLSAENLENIDLTEKEALEVILLLNQYPTILEKCLNNHDASSLISYLFTLIKCIFNAYNSLNVINCDDPLKAQSRLLFFKCCKNIVSHALTMLNITPLNKM